MYLTWRHGYRCVVVYIKFVCNLAIASRIVIASRKYVYNYVWVAMLIGYVEWLTLFQLYTMHITMIIFLCTHLQHWTKLKIAGAKPPARCLHAACYIAGPLTGQQHPLLMVVGGSSDNRFGDMWLLDVDKRMWNEVCCSLHSYPYITCCIISHPHH